MGVSEFKGDVKEVVGAVTGDRRVEAEGRVEQQVADPQNPVDTVTEGAVVDEEIAAKKAHLDFLGP